MSVIIKYSLKKELKESIGQPLKYIGFINSNIIGEEDIVDGRFGVENRPDITGVGRKFDAIVTMEDGLIVEVT